MNARQDCVFCKIVSGEEPAEIIQEWSSSIAIKPLNPVVEGHALVLPKTHVADFAENPMTSAKTMNCAALLAADMGDVNLITSKGVAATQSVFHLHLHLVPRKENDGLALPWYSGKHRKRKENE